MKKLGSRLLSISLLVLLLVITTGQKTKAQDAQVSYQTFYDDLSPYGQWVSDPQYGNVWVPNEAGDFRPYGTGGHWVMTDFGNTWVSDDPWGWACYHYGRWTYDPYYSWVWIPGYEWAPAWVSWRYGGGYSGWAPLGPGMDIGGGGCPDSWWVFVQPQYMYSNDCFRHWRGPSYNSTYIRQTSILNNAYVDNGTHVRYNYGPRADVIQHDTHQPVQVYHVSQTGRPGAPGISGRNLNMYRPAVNRATASTARPANAIPAPRSIGKPQAATNVSASHQAAFRQQAQQAAHTGGNAQPAQRSGNANHPQAGGNPQTQNRPQQAATQHQQPANRPQPAPQQHQQPQNRPQPAPQQHQQPQSRPQPAPQQRSQPQPQNRPQPIPQQRPQPMPQQHQQPMQQAPHAAPPHEEAPHGGGERR